MDPSLQQVGQAVKRLQWHHHREANRRLAELGLSLAQWDVLRNLHEHPDASLHTLAQLTFQTDQSMGTLATRMIDRGLLVRVAGPGRAIRHRLTPEGEQAHRKGSLLMNEILDTTIGTLPPSDRATLYRLLNAANPTHADADAG
ncbi:MarR family transcriptional regulator [Nocardia sp. ET3-3]|uniref:MarR family transcriptional regulator n=1 Tax=Nocardia terrae TaxID=2675851 RepID=A0A7K1V1C4_9NOCA|nr:MarR family transcriptional regulator [Nocardia terrae]